MHYLNSYYFKLVQSKNFLYLFILLLGSISFFSGECVAQTKPDNSEFIYGTLTGSTSFTGYFWFERKLWSGMGQRIIYKLNLEEKKGKNLYALNFKTFVSDSLFMRTFKTIKYGTGRLQVMLPRIVTGKLELYNAVYRGFYSFEKTDHYYLYDGNENIQLVRRKFKDQMKELLKDDADIIGRVEREEVTYDDMPSIIYNYNLRKQN